MQGEFALRRKRHSIFITSPYYKSNLPLSTERISVSTLCVLACLTAVDEEIQTHVSDQTLDKM